MSGQSTQLQEVMLRGIFRGESATVTFRRREDEWQFFSMIGKEALPMQVLDNNSKPCWTVALDIIKSLLPGKPRHRRKRLADRPKLRLYA